MVHKFIHHVYIVNTVSYLVRIVRHTYLWYFYSLTPWPPFILFAQTTRNACLLTTILHKAYIACTWHGIESCHLQHLLHPSTHGGGQHLGAWYVQSLHGLSFLHYHGILHRDIKPDAWKMKNKVTSDGSGLPNMNQTRKVWWNKRLFWRSQ